MPILRSLLLVCFALIGVTAWGQAAVGFPGTTNVGQQAVPLSVTVTMTAGGVSGTPQVVTQGISGADYTLAAGGSCASGVTYAIGATCTVNVAFSPKYPGLRKGAAIVPSSSGGVLGRAMVVGTGRGGLGVLQPGEIDTVAGSGVWIYRADGVPATSAEIFLPMGVATDAAGNMFISDSNNNRIRRVDAASGLISTVGGNGVPGYSGDNGPATSASISGPAGLVLDGGGNIYFADSGNHAVRRIDAVTGTITTVAGTASVQGYSGDGQAATSAKLSLPEGLGFDPTGNLYIADTGNNVVRMVDTAGIIRTFAGTGVGGYNGDNRTAASAMLNSPWNVFPTPDGSVLIADLNNNRVRLVSAAGTISTFAGSGSQGFSGDGAAATSAKLNAPAAVTMDPSGNVYIADSGNNRIRKVNAAAGLIFTVTGTNSTQFDGDGHSAVVGSLYGPYGVFFDQAGNLLISDMFHNRVRRIAANYLQMQFDTMRVGKISSEINDDGFENDGNGPMTLTPPGLDQAVLSARNTCNSGLTLQSKDTCIWSIQFAPTQVGDLIVGHVYGNSDAPNSPATIIPYGPVLSVEPTTVSLVSSKNPSLINDVVTFTATVTSADTNRQGNVAFMDGSTTLCTQALNTNGIASCSVNNLALGSHPITANYAGDENNASAVSQVLNQVVLQPTTLVLSASPNPAIVTQNVTLTLQASAATGTPTGTIKFYDGATLIGTSTLNASGVATFATTQLAPGPHSLTGQYSGDATDAPGTSNIYSEAIDRAPTVTTISTSNASVPVGTVVTFTSTVVSPQGPAPTGTVTFTDGSTTLGTATVVSNGTAILSLSTLTPGSHSIVANYSGDTNDADSSSNALTQIIQQLGTTTTLTSDANPANAGAIIHLTAQVAIAAGATPAGAITGQVTFSDGATVLGTAQLDVNGVATLPVAGLTVGSHALTATYAGNTNYAGSTSTALSQVVQSTTTTTSLNSSQPNSLAGKPVTFTAVVTSSTGGVPTGLVSFREDSTVLGQGALNTTGVATFTTSTLAVGSHSIVAVYLGDANYSTSTSTVLTQTVSLATTGLTLAGPAAPVNAGTTVTVTAALTGNGIAPTGTLTVREGATVIGTQNVTGTGTFTFTTSTLSIGSHTLVATYVGDANNAPATSNTITVVVQQASSTTTLVSSLNPALIGQNVTFTATVTSASPDITGTVSFMDGATALGSVPVFNGSVTFSTSALPFGQHVITAVYSGDTNHAGSTSPVLNQSIVQPASAAVVSSLNPSASGNGVVFTAKISGVGTLVPTGQVAFTDNGANLGTVALDGTGTAAFATSTLSVGSHTVAVNYAGDTNYSTATASVVQVVQSADTQVALTASSNPAVYGTPLTFSAKVTSNGGLATGTVSFADGGVAIGSALLDATGTATLTISTLGPGPHNIVANYAGDGKASPSSSAPLALIVKQLTSVAVLSSANPAQTLSPITFTATVNTPGAAPATGNVTFTDGTTNLGIAPLDANGRASITVPQLSAGNHSIQASYGGDGANFSAVSALFAQGVTLRPTTTALSSTQTDPSNPLNVTLIAVVHWNGTTTSPGGKVTFKTPTRTIGSANIDATGVATLTITLASASESIVASYEGDASYAASDSVATTISGSAATQFTMTINPSSLSLQSKQRGTVTLTLTSVKDFTDLMQFGCLGLPYAATCTFTATSGKLEPNDTQTVQLVVDTGSPLGEGVKVAGNSHGGNIALAFLPMGLFAGFVLARKRKTALGALLLALFGVAISMGITGCSGLTGAGTPAGTYAIKVTASGQGTGATQSQTLTLTVTQ